MQTLTSSGGLTFDRPEDLLRSELIDRGEKIRRLEVWENAVLHRLDSTNEGMPPNGTTDADMALLDAIEKALIALDAHASARGPSWRELQARADDEGLRDGPPPRG